MFLKEYLPIGNPSMYCLQLNWKEMKGAAAQLDDDEEPDKFHDF